MSKYEKIDNNPPLDRTRKIARAAFAAAGLSLLAPAAAHGESEVMKVESNSLVVEKMKLVPEVSRRPNILWTSEKILERSKSKRHKVEEMSLTTLGIYLSMWALGLLFFPILLDPLIRFNDDRR